MRAFGVAPLDVLWGNVSYAEGCFLYTRSDWKKNAPQQKPKFLLGTYRYIRFVSNFDNKAYFFWVAFSFVRFSQNNCEGSGPNLFGFY